MADMQSATAEIRRGKKRKNKEHTTGWKYGLPYIHRATMKNVRASLLFSFFVQFCVHR